MGLFQTPRFVLIINQQEFMRFFYALIFTLCGIASYAQTTLLTGTIVDAEDRFSLPGATIRMLENKRYTVSDKNGQFEFLNMPAGTYTLSIVYMGYTPLTQTITVKRSQENTINLQLTPMSLSLSEAQVIGDMLRGQAKALNQQKNNQNITNIISADQVGRFPDANIGDALKRVPGITMQNDQGEARNIIIRGLAPQLNSVTLNGDRIPSAEGDNRNVQMDLIPSDMIATIEVNKTLTSDMDADAIGGSVNLVTRASPNGPRLSATAAGGYSPIREKGNYTAGLVYGNRFANNKIGVVWSGSLNNNRFGSDNVEGVWKEGKKESVFMKEMDIRKYDVQRIRRSTALALDYKINEKNSLYANLLYNWRDDRENRYRLRYRNVEASYDADDQIIGYSGAISRETKGGIADNKNKMARLETQKVQNYALGGEHLLGTNVALDWSTNYAKASEERPHERYIDFRTGSLSLREDLSNSRFPLVSAEGDLMENFKLKTISENDNYTSESEFGAKLNVRFPFTVIKSQKGRLRTGLRMRLKDKSRDNIFYRYKPTTSPGTLGDVATNLFSGDGYQAGSKYVPGIFVDRQFLGDLALKNGDLFKKEAVPAEYLTNNYLAKEKIYAGYVRWDQDITAQLSLILGLRLEHTNIDYTGNYVLDEDELAGKVRNMNEYTNLLPNISFKYALPNSLILRAAYTTALARPNYYSLAPYVSVVSEDSKLKAGNPALKAVYAHNFDVMAEKYSKSIGLLSAGLFYKKLNDFIYTYVNKNYSNADFAADFPTQNNPIPSKEQWEFVQDRNGRNVDVYGFELAFQRQLDFLPGAFFKGFGVYVNYTFTKSKAKGISTEDGEERKGVSLPGTAPHMFNGSLSWENNRFSTRISLNYTADYLDALGAKSFDDIFYDKQLFLDANIAYKITKRLRLFAEANNLTNQPLRYYQGTSERTSQMEYYQSRFNLGLKFTM